jgi:hypothetical protein
MASLVREARGFHMLRLGQGEAERGQTRAGCGPDGMKAPERRAVVSSIGFPGEQWVLFAIFHCGYVEESSQASLNTMSMI